MTALSRIHGMDEYHLIIYWKSTRKEWCSIHHYKMIRESNKTEYIQLKLEL